MGDNSEYQSNEEQSLFEELWSFISNRTSDIAGGIGALWAETLAAKAKLLKNTIYYSKLTRRK